MPIYDLKTRIKNIQMRTGASPNGIFDLNTAILIQKLAGKIPLNSSNLFAHVRAIQNILRCDVDGYVGPETITRIENLISEKLPILPNGSSMRISKRSLAMLVSFEVSSEATYNKKYTQPIWPGGESGITIGIGYDLGFASTTEIKNAWGRILDTKSVNILLAVAGKKGLDAKKSLAATQSVTIDYGQAMTVFYQTTLPIFARRTRKVYQGVEKLPPDAQGALLSLIYNRGESTNGTSRTEMLQIVALVAQQNLSGIALQIRKMKRLWEGRNLPGLITRREKEAILVENANFNILPEDIIVL